MPEAAEMIPVFLLLWSFKNWESGNTSEEEKRNGIPSASDADSAAMKKVCAKAATIST